MLVVKGNRALDRSVTEDVPVGQVLGYNPRSRLILLRDIILMAFLAADGLVSTSR